MANAMRATMIPPTPGIYNGTRHGTAVTWTQESEGRGYRQMWARLEVPDDRSGMVPVIVEVGEDGTIEVRPAPSRTRGGATRSSDPRDFANEESTVRERPKRTGTLFVVTRPSAVRRSVLIQALKAEPAIGAPSGMDIETLESYEAWETQEAPERVMELARAHGVSRFVPAEMCKAF